MSIIQCNNTGKPEGVEEWCNRLAREDLTLALVCGCRNMDFFAYKMQPGAPAFNKKYYWQVFVCCDGWKVAFTRRTAEL